MKNTLSAIVLLLAPCLGQASENVAVTAHQVLTWPRMKADVFGCYAEKTFNLKDKRFNCSLKHYVNRGDPCKNTRAYEEGPAFPDAAAGGIHPLVSHVELSWEHGQLQSVALTFKQKLKPAEIARMFGLPQQRSAPRQFPNIMNIDIQECSKDGNCLILDGFDHLGGADVDCGS